MRVLMVSSVLGFVRFGFGRFLVWSFFGLVGFWFSNGQNLGRAGVLQKSREPPESGWVWSVFGLVGFGFRRFWVWSVFGFVGPDAKLRGGGRGFAKMVGSV